MRKISLALIGFQASGKTTLGRLLASHLKYSFTDTDQLIEQMHPTLNCREIFQQFGSSYFRKVESQVIDALNLNSPLVLAIGGGSLLDPANAMKLKSQSDLIYLKTSLEILKNRIWQRKSLPAYLSGNNPDYAFAHLYQEREKLYEKWADRTIAMDGLTEEEALQQLLQIVNI